MLRRRQRRSTLQGSEGFLMFLFLGFLCKIQKGESIWLRSQIFRVVSTPARENRLANDLMFTGYSATTGASANELAKGSPIPQAKKGCFHTNHQWNPPRCHPGARAQALLPKCDPAGLGTSSAWILGSEPPLEANDKLTSEDI